MPKSELEPIIFEVDMTKQTETIENVLCEMEDIGLVDNDNSKYNLANELRCYMGEDDFYKFLEWSCQVWGFDNLSQHFASAEK